MNTKGNLALAVLAGILAFDSYPRKLSPGITRLPMRPSSRSGRGLR